MDVGNNDRGVGNVIPNVGNDGVGVDGIIANGRNGYILVHCEFLLEAES